VRDVAVVYEALDCVMKATKRTSFTIRTGPSIFLEPVQFDAHSHCRTFSRYNHRPADNPLYRPLVSSHMYQPH
jgi:hypothetical protein